MGKHLSVATLKGDTQDVLIFEFWFFVGNYFIRQSSLEVLKEAGKMYKGEPGSIFQPDT